MIRGGMNEEEDLGDPRRDHLIQPREGFLQEATVMLDLER